MSDDSQFVVCSRYEVIYEYLRILGRPLTGLEQRAFLYLLDLDADERFRHYDQCMCLDFLPTIVQALEPDPIECTVAERNLDGQSYASQRWHTERVGRHQGIVLNTRTQKEHTSDLRKLIRTQIKDLEIVLRELLSRPFPEYDNAQAMIEGEMPKLLELTQMIARRRQRGDKKVPGLTWSNLREHLDATYFKEQAILKNLKGTLERWGVR